MSKRNSRSDRTTSSFPQRPQNRIHEQLEERVLFDAVPDASLDLLQHADDPFAPVIEAGADEFAVNAATAAEQAPAALRQEILFVDKGVEGYELLVADLVIGRNTDVVFLDQNSDGLQQMVTALEGRSDIDAIHIISHGDQAELRLGSATLTAASILGDHADELAVVRDALSDNADLLIYGCDFGQGDVGRAAVSALAAATGADVAASDDDTGSSELGGDWFLETRVGTIEAGAVVTSGSETNWTGLLAANDLQIDVSAAPNFVVDSNNPLTGPEAAYISATFTNTGTETLQDVTAFIGNYIDGSNDTPGIYESRTHSGLTGTFSLTHEGGTAGLSDATRLIGDLAPGESVTQYWLVRYPKVDDNGDSVVQGSKPDDDLFLNYDIWVKGTDSGGPISTNTTRTVYMRSEISAAANKIWPNGDNKVPQQYKDAINELLGWDATSSGGGTTAAPGETITTQGIWYDLGNVGQGFDNDGDLVPDKNVFLQPVGDPDSFDAGSFRLVRSYGLIIVKNKGGGETLIAFEDQLYHTDIPDNTGAVGLVFYEFVATGAGTSATISAYQEVASGKDNEKYSGDYGRGITISATDGTVAVDKTVDLLTIPDGAAANLTYTIDITNSSATASVGALELGLPLVIEDSIPDGTVYVAGSAAAANTLPSGGSAYTIRYSTDDGATWTETEPPAASVTNIQWWLDTNLAPSASGDVTFEVTVPASYTSLLVPNTGGVSFAGGALFASDDALTTISGTNTISGVVFADDGGTTGTAQSGVQEGDESGLSNIDVTLYYDINGNQTVDSEDVLWASTTSTAGSFSFGSIPDGDFIVKVDATDTDRPTGWSLLTDETHAFNLTGADKTDNHFGFTPSLLVDKAIVGSGPVYEGDEVSYTIDVTNLVSVSTAAATTYWGQSLGATAAYKNPSNAIGAPDGLYADDNFTNSEIDITGFDTTGGSGTISKVEIVSSLYFDNTANNDDFLGEVLLNGSSIAAKTYTNAERDSVATTQADQGELVWDITSAHAWTWSDFANVSFRHDSIKQAGPDAIIYLDGVGLRVTAEGATAGFSAEGSLTSVPLVDDFDESVLEFVSASVAPDGIDTVNGVLTWNNLGTINVGETEQVTVTFRALEPAGNVTQNNVSNVASVSGATFGSGESANNVSDTELVDLNPTATVSGTIWSDKDGGGSQNGGEAGIPGVVMELVDNTSTVIATTTTAADGSYNFMGVRDGDYIVRVNTATLPAGFTLTFDPDGTGGSKQPNESEITISTAVDVSSQDFGYLISNVVFGNVWQDHSGNGLQNSGENGISGATVQLIRNSDSAVVATVSTDVNGDFRFNGVADDTYRVRVVPTSLFSDGTATQTVDPDATFDDETTTAFSVGGGDISGQHTFAYRNAGTSSVGDRLFIDWNGNGAQDPGDEGISDVTISLYEDSDNDGIVNPATDALVATTVTADGSGADPAGFYEFTGLAAGNYVVVVDEYDAQFPAQLVAPANSPASVNLAASTADSAVDFGYQPVGSQTVSGKVFRDTNGDATQSGGSETDISGVTVNLLADLNGDGSYEQISSTTTATDGSYGFGNLIDGNYRISIAPEDSALPTDATGTPFRVTTGGSSTDVTLSGSGATATFGFGPLASIGDRIFYDANASGDMDFTEVGAAGVTVNLYSGTNTSGAPLATAVTSDGTDGRQVGEYRFTGLLPGEYTVVVDTTSAPISGLRQTADPDRDGISVDDNSVPGLPAADNAYTVTVTYGTSITAADFGYEPVGVAGDFVFLDTNGDGIQGAGEFGIFDAELTATKISGPADPNSPLTINTDPDGRFTFQGLTQGDWTIAINPATLPSSVAASGSPLANLLNGDGSVGADSATVTIDVAGALTHINGNAVSNGSLKLDFGYALSGTNSIAGTVVLEQQGTTDGNAGEPTDTAIEGLSLYIYQDNTGSGGSVDFLGSTTTAADGSYSFSNLPNGTYIVALSQTSPLLENTNLTTTTATSPASTVTDNGNTASQTLAVSGPVTNLDFAYVSSVNYDYDDLPSTYGTLLGDNPSGPRHVIPGTPNLYLGAAAPSIDADGQPSATASGDSGDDGISAVNISAWVDGTNGGTVSVDVVGSGWLTAWVDFDQDGTFSAANEFVISQAVATGTHSLSFDLPSGTVNGTAKTLNARFRLFESEPSVASLAYSGTAANGEVEGHQFTIPGSGGNNAPTTSNQTVSTSEDTTRVFASTDFPYSDADSDPLASITITSVSLPNGGVLEYDDGSGFASVTTPQTITKAELDSGNLRFRPDNDENGAAYAFFDFTVSDGTDNSTASTITVDVDAVNDTPDAAAASASRAITLGTPQAITGLSVSDIDAGSNDVIVTLTVNNGTLSVSDSVSGGLATGDIANNGTATVTLTGTISEINTTLADAAGATYTPASVGAHTLTLSINDQGNTGTDPGTTGTASNETDSVNMTLNVAAATPPSIDLDASAPGSGYSASFTEGGSPTGITDTDFTLNDPDSSEMQSVTITPSGIVNGGSEILTFHGDAATSITVGLDGVAAATQQITLNGAILDVNYDGTDITITRNGGGVINNSDVAAMLTAATYQNATAAAIPGDRTLSISVSDGAFDSNQAVATITVIPDYLTVANSNITINEDESTQLGVTVDPDLYLGGPLQDVVGTATGFRASSAGTTTTDFTIPDNVTGIVITGYSTEPDDTAADNTYNDDYQTLSAYIDVADGKSNGTLTRHIDLSGNANRDADQYSWIGAELGTGVLDGSATLSGETAAGTNPVFSISGNTLSIVENHGLETAYHVEFMTSNRESTNFVGTLSDAQLPGDTVSTFTIPTGANYLILTENAAAPGSNFRFEYKGFSRIYVDLDTMTASGTIAAEYGESGTRTVTYAFENLDISTSVAGGILASGATIVGDTSADAAIQHSPNIYINGSGELVVERTSAFATSFTSMYTAEAYQRTGYSSIAAIVDANADDQFFNATANGGVVNTLTFEVPASAQVGVFRLSMGTPGGNGDNENMGTGFAIIDLASGTSSGSFMNIRTTTPDLLSWSDVPLTDAAGGIDDRVFFTDPNTVSNRASLSEFTDGWGGTAYFDLVTNPDGTRTITFNAISDVGDNAYQDYNTHGQFTWLGNEPFRIRTGGAGGTFSHGSPILDSFGNPTGDWEIDVLDLPNVTYTPDPHYSGTGYLEVELLSTGEYERIDINVLPIADTPTLTLTDPAVVNRNQTSDLSGAISAALVDTDGSESITLIELSGIADGFAVSDGTNNFTAGGGTNSVDITTWNLTTLTMDSAPDFGGTESVTVRVQTTDNKTINSTPYSDTTLPTDGPGEAEATGVLNVRWQNVIAALDLDADNSTASAADYAATFTEGGAAVAIADSDTTLVDVDDTTMTSITITPGVGEFTDGTSEILTLNGDAATSVAFPIDGAAAATQQLTVNGILLDIAYDGTAFVITRNGSGEIPLADVVAVLESTTYHNIDPTPATTDRTFAIKVNDGDDSNVATSTISVAPDAAAVSWSITGPGSADEGGAATFSIDLSSNLLQAGETASVVLTLSDTSTTSTDYENFLNAVTAAVASRSDLSFDSGSRTLTYTSDGLAMSTFSLPLSITNDSNIEGPESFTVALSGAASTTGETITVNGTASSAAVTINDTQSNGGATEGPGEWSLTGSTTVDEGGTALYTLALSGNYGDSETATVQINLSDISTNSSDYAVILAAFASAATANPDVTFDGTDTFTFTSPADGGSMADLTISLGITDDTLIEGSESFSLAISAAGSGTGANVGLSSGSTTVTTTVNDTQGVAGAADGPAQWSLSGPSSVTEGSVGNYTISLSGTYGNNETASITLGLTDNSTSAADHSALLTAIDAVIASRPDLSRNGNVLTFTSQSDGDSMADLAFSLTATQDNIVEANEDFDVTLSAPGSTSGLTVSVGTASVNTVINDDADTAEVTIAAGTDGNEAGPVNGTFTVSLSQAASTDTVINYTVGGTANGSDHSLTAGTVTITAGSTSATITVPVTDDSLIEGTENVSVTLTSINSGDPQISVGATDTASIDILDNNATAGQWSLSGPSSVTEGSVGNYTISLSGSYGNNETASITLGLTDNSTSAADHSALLTAIDAVIASRPDLSRSGNVLTFTSQSDGDSMADLAFSLTATQDSIVEANEDFDVTLSAPGSTSGLTVSVGTASVNTVINDDADTAEVSIAAGTDGNEAGPVNGTFTVSLSQAASTDTVINYTVGGTANGSDHSLTAGTVTITAGSTSATITVPVTDDSLIEGTENVSVTLTSINSGDPQISVGATDTASIDILDNESAALWSLTGSPGVDEGATAIYTLSLSGAFDTGDTATVQIDLSDLTTDSADYDSVLSALTTAATANSDVTFNGTDTFTFTSPAAGASMADLTISLGISDDSLIEGPETFRLAIANPGSTTDAPVNVSSATSVTTTIYDTQGVGGSADGPAVWSVSGSSSVDEGGTAAFTIRLSEVLQAGEDVSVLIDLADIDSNSADYANFASAIDAAVAVRPDLAFNSSTGRLTFTGTGSAMADLVVNLSIVDDSAVEGPEMLSVTLSGAASTSGAATTVDTVQNSVTTTINDTQGIGGAPDSADWSMDGDVSLDEGGSATFTIGLDSLLQAAEVASIELSLIDIEATAADRSDILSAVESAVVGRSDLSFDKSTGVLTFTSTGSLMSDLTVSVSAIDDTLAEGPERYQLLLSNPGSSTGAVIGVDASNNNLTTTIRDTVGDGGVLEEVIWSFGFDQTVPEGNSSLYVLSLSGTMQAGESASVEFDLADIDTSSADYDDLGTAIAAAVSAYNGSAEPGFLSWDGTTITYTSDGTGPMTDVSISLGTVNDVLVEGVEDIRVGLRNARSATGVAVSIDALRDDGVTTIDDTTGPGADEATWSVSGATDVDEGGTQQYAIRLAGTLAATETATLRLTLGDISTSSADYGDFAAAVQSAVAIRSDLSFNATTGILTYTGDGTPMADLQIDLAITDDLLTEGPEQFDLILSDAGSTSGALVGIDALQNNVTTTINDTVGDGGAAEPGGEWTIAGTSAVNEGNSAAYAIAVSGNLQSGESASVEISFTDLESNSADRDSLNAAVQAAVSAYSGPGSVTFNGSTGQLTFISDGTGPMSPLNITLNTTADSLVEGPERFRIDMGNPQSSTGLTATVSAASGSLTTTIIDDESATWGVTGSPSVDEGGNATLTFVLAGQPQAGEQISTVVSLVDVGTNSADYATFTSAIQVAIASRSDLGFDPATGTLTFTGTGTVMTDLTVSLPITDDSLTEGVEDFRVELSLPSSATGSSVQLDSAARSATVTIQDTVGNGGAAESANWSVSAANTVDEGGTLSYAIALSGTLQAGEDASVQLGFADRGTSAADRADFDANVLTAVAAYTGPGTYSYDTTSATLTFVSSGSPADPLTIHLPIVDDSLLEGPEDLQLALTGGASTTGSTIGVDSGSAVIVITINDTQGVGGPVDGPAAWSLSGNTSADEGGAVNYTLSLSDILQAGENASVTINLNDVSTDSADHADLAAAIDAAVLSRTDLSFNASTGVLTFTGTGATMADLDFRLNIADDSVVEGDESFVVSLTNATSSTGVAVVLTAGSDSVSTVINDTQGVGGRLDTADWSISGSTTVDEGGTANFTISLDSLLQAGEQASVDLTLIDFETNSSDYTDFIAAVTAAVSARPDLSFDAGAGRLTFTSTGAVMSDLTFSVAITDDTLAEGPERFQIGLSSSQSSTGAAIGLDPSAASISTTINDTVGDGGPTEQPVWSLIGPANGNEGTTAQYTISLSDTLQAGDTAVVVLSLADIDTTSADHADFATAVNTAVSSRPDLSFDTGSGTLTFTSTGVAMADLTIDLSLINEVLVEGPEDYRVSLANPGSTTGVDVSLDSARDDAETTIVDSGFGAGSDDATWSIAGSTSVDEGSAASMTISLAGILAVNETAFVDLALTNLETSSADYADFLDAVDAAVSGRSDLMFDRLTGRLTFTGNNSAMGDLTVNLNISDDAIVEGAERFNLSLGSSGSTTGASVGIDAAQNQLTTTINDTVGSGGDTESVAWTIAGTGSVDEGGTATVIFGLNGILQAGETASVVVSLSDLSTTVADRGDFFAALKTAADARPDLNFDISTGILTSTGTGAAMTDLAVTFPIADDTVVEGPEQFRVALSNANSDTGALVTIDAGQDDLTTTINDTVGDGGAFESAEWSLTTTTNNADEGGAALLTLSLSEILQAGETAYVRLHLADISTTPADHGDLITAIQSAISGRSDLAFDVTTQTLTFTSSGAAMSPLTIALPLADDALTEGPEDFRVSISGAGSGTGSSIGLDSAADEVGYTINDTVGNGGGPETASWNLTGSNEVREGSSASYRLNLNGTLQAGETARVQLSLVDDSTSSADHVVLATALQTALVGRSDLSFDATAGILTYTGDGLPMPELIFSLAATVDGTLESAESFRVVAGNPSSTTGASVAVAGGTITTTITDVSPAASENSDPIASDDTFVVFENETVGGSLLNNDSDPDGDVFSINTTPVVAPSSGSLTINTDGTFTYVPNAGFNGSDSFAYQITDADGNTDTATVTISVTPDHNGTANDRPTTAADIVATQKNVPAAGSVLDNDTDVNGQTLTVTSGDGNAVSFGSPAVFTTGGGGNVTLRSDGTFDYIPADDFTGTDSFTYFVSDGNGGTAAAVVTLNVFDGAPIARDDINITTTGTSATGNVLENDSAGLDRNDLLTVNVNPVTLPTAGVVAINSDGTYTYTPNPGFEGTDSFEYRVSDEAGNEATATVTVEVRNPANSASPGNTAPIASNDLLDVLTNGSVTTSVTANDGDPNGDTIRVTAVNGTAVPPGSTATVSTSSGTVTLHADGTTIYTPSPGFIGEDKFVYTVTDDSGNTDTATVTVTVAPDRNGTTNNDPVGGDDAGITTMNVPVSGNLLQNDVDINNDSLSVIPTPVSGPANGTLTLSPGGDYTYTPNDDFTGTDSFVYEVSDGMGGTTTATVYLSVSAQPPVASPDRVVTTAGLPVSGNVLTNDTDVDVNDSLTVNPAPVVSPANGSLTLASDGSFVYTPNAGFTGVDSFTYEVFDDAGLSDTATVTIAMAHISSTAEVVDVVPNGENFDTVIRITVQNTGGTTLDNITLSDDIAAQFGDSFLSVANPVLDPSGITSGVAPAVNSDWTADTAQPLLDPATASSLAPGESFTVTFTVATDPDAGGTSSPVSIQAQAGGTDNSTALPVAANDLSDAGSDPTSTNPLAAGDTGSADDATPVLIVDAGLTSEVTDIERDGISLILTIDFTLENTGTADLSDLKLLDDLRSQFGDNFDAIVSGPTITNTTAATDPNVNSDWNGDGQNMFDGTSGHLKPGESITVQIQVKTLPSAATVNELIHQGQGGGQGMNPDGSPVTDGSGNPIPATLDLSDSGNDPNGTNPGAPGDTGGTADSTATAVEFYRYDSFNEFSAGHGSTQNGDSASVSSGVVPMVEQQILTKQINTLAPEPIFSGSARPGTRIIGRIYDSAGHVIGETMSFADTGGNWMLQFHNVNGLDFHRIEFVELVGQGDPFGAYGDIYGYLGVDAHNNDYAAMEPITAFAERFSLGSVFRGSNSQSLEAAHRRNNNPLGFGV